MGDFKIKPVILSGSDVKISKKVVEYLERYIIEHILIPKNIIMKGKWNIWLAYHFIEKGPDAPEKIIMASKPQTTISESGRTYSLVIPKKWITTATDASYAIIDVFLKGIKLFLIENFKKIDSDFIDNAFKDIDMQYLISLPYPPSEGDMYIFP